MNTIELFREAFTAIRANRLRSFLTLLGIIIGVSTLVSVGAVITGLNAFVRDKVFNLAPDVFVVQKFGIIRSREEFLAAVRRPNLDWRGYEVLRSRLTRSEHVAAEMGATTFVKARDRRLPDIRVIGTTANYGPMMRLDVIGGRFFSEAEDRAAMELAVIGWDIKDELFPQMDPIGRELLVGGKPYRIIGLMAKQGRTPGPNRDARIYVPFQAYRTHFGLQGSMNYLLKARDVERVDEAVDEMRAVMRAHNHTGFNAPDPFGVITADSLQDLWRQISAAAFILSLLIASVSLGVGGIVIMNIMLVAVVERTREIGVRRALGARKKDIRRQFLLEAAVLSLFGGMVGVAIGALAAAAIRNGIGFPAELTPPIAVAGLLLSGIVGIVAGYWPARAASNLPVVDALRTE